MADLVSSVHIIATDETSAAYVAATANARAHTDAVQGNATALAGMSDTAKAGADSVSGLADAHKQATESAEKFGEGIKNFIEHPLESAGSAVKGIISELGPMGIVAVGAAGGIALLSKEVYDLVNEEGQAARQTQNFATTLGVSFEEAKKLGEMAKIVDVNIGGLSRAAFKLAEALQNPTGKEGEELKKLGVTATEAGPALIQVLEKLSEITNATDRMAAARVILGRAAVSMAPLIQDYDKLSTAVEELGGHLSGDAVKGLLDTREHINELGIAWDHLKEQTAAKLSPTVEIIVTAIRQMVTGNIDDITGMEAELEQRQHDAAKKAADKTMSEGLAQVAAGSAAIHTGIFAGLKSASEDWVGTYSKSLPGLKADLEHLEKQHKDLAVSLQKKPTAEAPFDAKGAADYAAQTKKIADLQQQIKAAEKSESGAGVSERNAAAEKMIEQDKARALQRVKLEEDTAKWMRATNQITEDQETAELVTAQNRRFQIEKDAAEKINALKASTARAEHKPAEPGTDITLLAAQNEEKVLAIKAKGAAEDKKDREKAFEDKQKISLELFNLDEKREEEQRKIWFGYYEDMIKAEAKQFQAAEVNASARVAAAKSEADMQRMVINAAYDAGNISLAERVKRLKEVEEAEYRVAVTAAFKEKDAAVDSHDTVKTAEADKKIQELAAAYNMAMEKINIDGAKKSEKPWDQYFQSLESNFNRSINSMITGQEKFGKAVQSMWRGFVTDSLQALEHVAEQWLVKHVIMAAVHKMFTVQNAAVDTSAKAAEVAVNNAANIAMATSDVGMAAATAFAEAMAEIPFPANLVAAPTIAANVIATGAPFVAMASAARGADLPGENTMIFAHPREMVLPESLANVVRSVAAQGGTRGGGGTTNNYHGYPGESPHSVTQNTAAWQRAHRDGRLRLA
jgi:hypothetical protein